MAKTSKPQNAQDSITRICDALRQAIIEQALKPGTKLPEDMVGERFGVGRTIARQALAQLAAEGLIDHKRNKGAEVATPSWEEARDLFDLRMSLEQLIVTRLAGKLTRDEISILRKHVEKESGARNTREAVSVRLATEFHTILAEMTRSPVLIRYVQEVCRRCGLTLTLYARPHSADCAISEHIAIIDALEKGDAKAAIRIMHHHLEQVANRALISPAVVQSSGLMDTLAPYANGESETPARASARVPPRAKPAKPKSSKAAR